MRYKLGDIVYFVKPHYFDDTVPYILSGEVWSIIEKTKKVIRIDGKKDGKYIPVEETKADTEYEIYSDELEEQTIDACCVSKTKEVLLDGVKTLINSKLRDKKNEIRNLESKLKKLSYI